MRSQSTVGPIGVIRPAARAETRGLLASAGYGVVDVAVQLARPWPLALAVQVIADGSGRFGLAPVAMLAACGVGGVVLTAFGGWARLRADVHAETAAERVGARLRQQIFEHAMSLSLRWHDRGRTGELVSRLTTDVGRLLDALVALCSTMLPDALRLVLVVGVLFVIDPRLALVALAVVPVLGLLASRQRVRVRAAESAARGTSGQLSAGALDLLRNVRAVQAFGRLSLARTTFAERNARLCAANTRAVTVEARWAPLADVTLAVGTGVVLVIGGREALAGQLDAAQLIVIMSYVSALYSPVRSLSRLAGVLGKAGASAERIHAVLGSDECIVQLPAARRAPHVEHAVQFVDVRFAYDDAHPVLKDFSLTVPAGRIVCLLGPSGVGKSTVLQLLLRLYDVDAGAVLIDGVDVRALDVTSLRERIAFVPQDPWLLDASIADNIAFGVPQATRHRVLHAACEALVDEFAQRLPLGYDTPIGESGAALSGGQRRRIALARAAMSDAPLLLLDEPTASLDQDAAAFVTDAVRRAAVGRTVVLVTHDLTLSRIADHVVTLAPEPTHRRMVPTDLEYRKEVPA